MSKKLVLFSVLSTLLLTACGNNFQPKFEATYQILPSASPATNNLTALQPIVDARLNKLNLPEHELSIANNQLVAKVDTKDFDISTASIAVAQNTFSLQESRSTLTDSEKAAVQTYNQAQKQIMTAAYEKAKANVQNIDDIVMSTSEKVNQTGKGIRGTQNKAQVKNDAYWNALTKTDVGQITDIVETPTVLWFAKVLEKNGTDPEKMTIKYQEAFRLLKLPEPYLGYSPVLDLSQDIDQAEVIKKDEASLSNKNFAVKVTLTENGKKKLDDISKQYQEKTLRVFVNNFPYASVKMAPNSNGIIMIDDDYNQSECQRLVNQLQMPYLPAMLGLINFKVL